MSRSKASTAVSEEMKVVGMENGVHTGKMEWRTMIYSLKYSDRVPSVDALTS
jgi:hypothetical protein